jgi:CRISPR-associated protein Cse2 (CRISPR_cse2)
MAANSDYDVVSAVFFDWWRELQSLNKSGNPIKINGSPKSPDRKALAELRRINIVHEGSGDVIDVGRALGIEAFRDLVLRLKASDLHPGSKVRSCLNCEAGKSKLEPFAIAAATVARIREDSDTKSSRCGATARMLGEGFPDCPFAEARFKRLMRSRDETDLMAQARRISAILERTAPIGDLAASLVLWNDEPRIRREWAFQYYQKSFEAPRDEPESPALTAASKPPSPTV